MVRDIFEEFPVVKRAFDDNVPKKVYRLLYSLELLTPS